MWWIAAADCELGKFVHLFSLLALSVFVSLAVLCDFCWGAVWSSQSPRHLFLVVRLPSHPVAAQTELLSWVMSRGKWSILGGLEVRGWEPSLSSSFINCTCTHNTHSLPHTHTPQDRTGLSVACSHLQSIYCPVLLGAEVSNAKKEERRRCRKIMCWEGLKKRFSVYKWIWVLSSMYCVVLKWVCWVFIIIHQWAAVWLWLLFTLEQETNERSCVDNTLLDWE